MIPESMALYFLAGAVFGAIAALFFLFLIGLLYRLDSMNSEHLCADEVDFDSERKPAEIHELSYTQRLRQNR